MCSLVSQSIGVRSPACAISVAGQPKDGPLFIRLGAQRAIKLDCRLVPIEHRPFHSSAAALPRDLRQTDEKCAPVAFAPLIRPNEKIFQIKSRADPARWRNCERKPRSRPATRLPRASSTSAAGRSPKKTFRKPSSVATTSFGARSYVARSRINSRMVGNICDRGRANGKRISEVDHLALCNRVAIN